MNRVADALAADRAQKAIGAGAVLYVALIVALPLAALAYVGLADGVGVLWQEISSPVARAALWLTVWTSAVVAVVNGFIGTATAWVLVRYPFPGRSILSALVDLPLAIPTLVAGMMLAVLYGHGSFMGGVFEAFGIELIFAPPGIVLALAFVTLPLVVRAVEPVLLEIDPAEEEAARVLGASPFKTFQTVHLPAIVPAALSGAIRSLGRALGEFGSIVVVAGNIPFKTLTAPVYVYGEIESGAPRSAAALSVVLLVVALGLHGLSHVIERQTGSRRG